MRTTRSVMLASAVLAGLCGPAATRTRAEAVDLANPFEADRDTVSLFHLDDVRAGAVKDAADGGRPGKGWFLGPGATAR